MDECAAMLLGRIGSKTGRPQAGRHSCSTPLYEHVSLTQKYNEQTYMYEHEQCLEFQPVKL